MYKFSIKPQKTERIETEHRKIVTNIPSPESIKTIKACMKYEPDSMNNQLPVVWDYAVDYQVFDKSGNCWIDFTSTIFVTNAGHSHPDVCSAVIEMGEKCLLNAYYYPTEVRAEFAKLVVSICPGKMEKVLFLSTGSEAVEASIKMARLYSKKNLRRKKSVVVAFEKSFHGKTMGSQMVGGKPYEKQWIGYQHPEIVHIPFPYPWVLEEEKTTGKKFFEKSINVLKKVYKLSNKDIAAFISEPYQGWCAIFLPNDYAQAMRRWCNESGALLIFDEVQSGFGRTGSLFAFEHFDVIPDIIVCGKGISSSLPLSAVITKSDIANLDESFNSTHGGNPVAIAASLASVTAILKENLVQESERKGKILEKELMKWQNEKPEFISKIFCKGLLASVFISVPKNISSSVKNDVFVDMLIEEAMRRGVLSVRTCSGTLKIGPPLTIPDEAIREGVEVLKQSLDICVKKIRNT